MVVDGAVSVAGRATTLAGKKALSFVQYLIHLVHVEELPTLLITVLMRIERINNDLFCPFDLGPAEGTALSIRLLASGQHRYKLP